MHEPAIAANKGAAFTGFQAPPPGADVVRHILGHHVRRVLARSGHDGQNMPLRHVCQRIRRAIQQAARESA
jgi:hypothetical protein